MIGKILGYEHGNRGTGIRNHQLILPSVVCSTHVARRIALEVDAITFAHQHGCGIIGEDVAGIDNFFIALADHPNVQSVLVIALGCETIQGQELAAKLTKRNLSTQYRIIQESGGVEGTVTAGVKAAKDLRSAFEALSIELESLHVGIDLGREVSSAKEIEKLLKNSGCTVTMIKSETSSADTFSRLAEKKAHIIVSFPSNSQPASGFPLIPVINVAGSSVLHQAIRNDFDADEETLLESILSIIGSVANGRKTIAEFNMSGEIRAPRIVRSV